MPKLKIMLSKLSTRSRSRSSTTRKSMPPTRRRRRSRRPRRPRSQKSRPRKSSKTLLRATRLRRLHFKLPFKRDRAQRNATEDLICLPLQKPLRLARPNQN